MNPVKVLKTAMVAIGAFAAVMLQAQEANTDTMSFTIPRVSNAPQIDGRMSPGEWANAVIVDNLHQVEPVEFAAPNDRTVFYLMYDDDAIYVAAYAYDSEPDKISALTLRQGGSIWSDDRVAVLIDPFNNKRSGYDFRLNPNGVRLESIYTNGTDASHDWEGIWNGAAKIVEDGWIAEMEIPFKTLSFDPANSTWGVNLWRSIERTQEFIAWSSYNGATDPTVAGEMTGLSNLNQGVGLDVVPSLTANQVEYHQLGDSESEIKPSLDVTYKLTPSLNLSLTLNTDFSATEVDGRQLDLDRFSLFFPEKRSFFLTDFDIFNFGGIGGENNTGVNSGNNGLPFFSRRIGIGPDGSEVDLTAGLKLSGRMGGYDVGMLVINQDSYSYRDRTNTLFNVDSNSLFIARVQHQVLEESALGAIFTQGDPGSNLDAQTAGIDFAYRNNRLANNRSLLANVWYQQTNNEGVNGDDSAYSASFSMPTSEGWYGGAQFHRAEANFDPAIGFANRTDVELVSGTIGWQQLFRDHPLLQRNFVSLGYQEWNYISTGALQSREYKWTLASPTTKAGDSARLQILQETEGLLPGEQPLSRLGFNTPAGEYDQTRLSYLIRTSGGRPLSFEMRGDFGEFYTGTQWGVSPRVTWKPSNKLSFALDYTYDSYNFPEGRAITRVVEFTNELVFSASKSLVTLVQYDNLSRSVGINSRFRWNIQPGQDFWVVLNHNMEDLDADLRFAEVQSTLALKLRYTFRY